MRYIFSLISACLFAWSAPLAAKEPKPLFAAAETIHIVIQAPLSGLIRNRSIQTAVSGMLTDPIGLRLPINVTLRGHVNRTSETCEFPPLRIDFTTPPPATSVFAGQKKLKLVTHCRNNASNQQYILLDYTAYRMYNLLTPLSFRARLADVDYRGADGQPIISRVGFFIEDEHDVARRNGLQEVKVLNQVPLSDLNPIAAARYALFEHLIANHDWSMRAGPAGENCCHNAKLIGALATGAAIPVPYDFDFSGLVDAPYATVPDALRISSVRQRVYRGYCAHNADVLAVARQMRETRPQLIAAVTSTPGLDPHTQSHASSFLDGFFVDIATDDAVKTKLLRRCVS